MKFTAAAIVALCSLNGSDAFMTSPLSGVLPQNHHATTTRTSTTTSVSTKMAEADFSGDFEDALKDKGEGDGNEEDEVGSGSSRFKELMKAAQSGDAEGARMPVAIQNPFLNPTTPAAPSQPLASTPNPDELSVEEQARMFREMMAQQQGSAETTASPPPPQPQAAPQRTAKTDRSGRPVGRNRDADTISNTADLYFAQLKRDSTVRTMARIRGEDEVAEQVFEDEGIKQLEGILVENPHLTGHREKEMQLIEEVPEEALAPYFRSDELSEEEKAKSGPSYKKKLMERKQKLQGGNAAAAAAAPQVPEVHVAEKPVENVAPAVVEQSPEPVASPPPVESAETSSPQSAAAPVVQSNPEESRQKIRTLMGMILKHRGGPGFGKGRLQGPEIDRFDKLMNEVTAILREEAKNAQPVDTPLTSTAPAAETVAYQAPEVAVAPPQSVAAPETAAVSSSAAGASTDIDSMIACIEGAVTMYKNSPPVLQQSVLVTLRAALVSAVDTCNNILASEPPPAVGANPDGRIDNTIVVIEGAITMYKNSPPALKDSVLVTLRAALISAVETCSLVVDGNQPAAVSSPVQQRAVASPSPAATTTIATPEPVSPPPPVPAIATDPNSRKLEGIYANLKASAGDGRLGLRSDITPDEAKNLADQLIEMRSTLMEEIEIVPTSKPAAESKATGSAPKYQQMLAKARAKKAAG